MSLRRIFQKMRQDRAIRKAVMDSRSPPESFFSNDENVKEYVESELKRVVPADWNVECLEKMPRFGGPALEWVIRKTQFREGDWPDQDYRIQVSKNLELFVILYGNRDIGGFGLWHVLQSAMVIHGSCLRSLGNYNLGDCVEYVMKNLKPNEWGYT